MEFATGSGPPYATGAAYPSGPAAKEAGRWWPGSLQPIMAGGIQGKDCDGREGKGGEGDCDCKRPPP